MALRFSLFLPAILLATVLALAMAGPALAHEDREVGDYEFEVGFVEEPALVNQLNGVFLAVAKDGEPVLGLDQTLKVELTVGGGAESKELAFEGIPDEPGAYAARFLPTLAGDYTFRIFGDIEGAAIDETFESGPGRFEPVESIDELAFPEAAGDSSLAQTVQDLQEKVDGLDGGSSSDSTARALGIAGLVVGLAGLVAGGIALIGRRS